MPALRVTEFAYAAAKIRDRTVSVLVHRSRNGQRRPQETGRHATGLHERDLDPELRDLACHRLEKAFHAPFRRVVETRSGKDDLTAHAAHLHDPAAALGTEVRQHGSGQVD